MNMTELKHQMVHKILKLDEPFEILWPAKFNMYSYIISRIEQDNDW